MTQSKKNITPITKSYSDFDSLAAEEQLIILFDNYSAKEEQKIYSYEEIFKDINAIQRTAVIISEMSDYYEANSDGFSNAETKSIMLTVGMLEERIKASHTALYEIIEGYLNNPDVEEVYQIKFNFAKDKLKEEFKEGRYEMFITSHELNQLKANESSIIEVKKEKSLEMAKWRKELMLLNM